MLKHLRTIGIRAAGVLVGLLTLTLITSPHAFGATRTTHDATRDTYRPDRDQQHMARGVQPNGDITSVRTSHRADTITVLVRLRKLRPGFNTVLIEMMTSAKHHRHYVITGVALDHTFNTAGLAKGDLTKTHAREVRCGGLRVRFDNAQATIRATIPTRCIGNPSWVRTGVMLMAVSKKQTADRPTLDVAGKGAISERWWARANHLPLSGKVYVAKMR